MSTIYQHFYTLSVEVKLTRMGDFTYWRVFDCKELLGGYSQEMMGLVLGEGVMVLFLFHSPTFE